MKLWSRQQVLSRVNKLLSHYEKVLLAILSVVIVISGSVWFKQLSLTKDGPTAGGSYVEGIVGGEEELQQTAVYLTKTGLFTITADGQLNNQLITSWQANPERTDYTFTLKPGIDPQEISDDLTLATDLIGPVTVEVMDQQKLRLTSATPLPNLPIILAQPIFNYGPYKLSKFNSTTSIFSRNGALLVLKSTA